jgi:hypothetical protein
VKVSCEEIARKVLGEPMRRSGSELRWRCPNHDDRDPSLFVNIRKDCFLCGPCGASGNAWKLAAFLAHYDPDDKPLVTAYLREQGLLSQLRASRPRGKQGGTESTHRDDPTLKGLALTGKHIAEVYRYTDRDGNELFINVRYQPKDFRMARPNGKGGYIFGTQGVPQILFRLPEVERAREVLLLEGEKDALTAASLGFCGTTKPHGAKRSLAPFLETLRGKDVVICYDRDEAGRAGAAADLDALRNVARSRKFVFVPEGKDLSDWIAQGGTGEALRKLIDETPLLHLPPPTAPIKSSAEKCPTIPDAAYYGISHEYGEIVGPLTEASRTYHLAAFLTAVGAALGRSVYLQHAGTIYPNLFTVIVGPSGGARKSTALDFCIQFLEKINTEIGIERTIDSREGFIQRLQDVAKEKKRIGEGVCALVRLGELRSLIDKTRMEGLRNIVPALCDAYDCPSSLVVQTRQNPLKVESPTVSMFAATTKRWIEGLSEEDMEGGLGNRIAWVPGEPGNPIPHPPGRDWARWDQLVATVRERVDQWIKKGSSKFSLAADTRPLWEKIYGELYGHRNDEALIAVLCERLQNHCLKTALIFAALDGTEQIERCHLDAAYAFTQFLYDSLWYLFAGFGMSPMAQLDGKIIEALQKAPVEGMRQRHLKKKFWRIDAETFNKRLYSLTGDDGPLIREKIGQQVIIRLADSLEDIPS